MVAIAITRLDLTATELRAASAKSRDAPAARRMLALALVLEGVDRKTAAETCGMDRQTLRDWVHRYNAGGLGRAVEPSGGAAPTAARSRSGVRARGLAGGRSRPGGGRRGSLAAAGPARRITDRFGVELHERTVGKYLAALGYRRLSVRPRHPKTDPEAQDAFKKASPWR